MNPRFPLTPPQLPLAGNLLVATNKCAGSHFEGAVCLVLSHTEDGSSGLLLNRPIDFDPTTLWKHLVGDDKTGDSDPEPSNDPGPLSAPRPSNKPGLSKMPVRFGGPVSGPILALHNQAELAEASAAEGVYIAARLDKLQKLFAVHSAEVRIVVGQATWKPGQLEAEIEEGAWLPIPATPEIVFAPEQHMWMFGMREIGNRFVEAIVGARAPSRVRLN